MSFVISYKNFKTNNINKSFEKVFQYGLKNLENKEFTKILWEDILYDNSYSFRETIETVAWGYLISRFVEKIKLKNYWLKVKNIYDLYYLKIKMEVL
ncbi:hypothetical protein ACF3M2_10630 [Tissierella carlieri]|uniref:hypothetical protein n=1 Tax=Tissierella carlieri TaxID=689904 RepID=UPI00386A17B2